MKKITLLLAIAATSAGIVSAKGITPVGIDSIQFDRQGDYMMLNMNVNLQPTDVQSTRAQILTPLIVSEEGDTLALPSVGVYGRLRYINYLRNGEHPLSGGSEELFRSSERPADYRYHTDVPYEAWMNNSELLMRRRLYGCADCLIEERIDPVTKHFEPSPLIPEIVYFEAKDNGPVIESLEGAAYIDFIVDKTFIAPEYRRNPQELLKIQSSIDTVLNDKDVTITGVWLKGFASPESPYSHNTDLAIGRTEAIKRYINQLYNFKDDIISTDYEPEDWEGLRRFVANSNIDHKAEILEIIDSDMAPDPKEAYMKKKFPAEYKFMLETWYPALRHTEYRITYEVKRFDDLDKIREVMRTKPNRLTLREFFLLGNACKPGSEEFNEVYETAVRMYPNDPVANINAANAALQRKDYTTAQNYLAKAGDSPEAIYARGSLAFLLGRYDEAEALMKEVPMIPASRSTLEEIAKIRAAKEATTAPTLLQ
jgi:tetratricopeptide (TPR) repeat protein